MGAKRYPSDPLDRMGGYFTPSPITLQKKINECIDIINKQAKEIHELKERVSGIIRAHLPKE